MSKNRLTHAISLFFFYLFSVWFYLLNYKLDQESLNFSPDQSLFQAILFASWFIGLILWLFLWIFTIRGHHIKFGYRWYAKRGWQYEYWVALFAPIWPITWPIIYFLTGRKFYLEKFYQADKIKR